MSDHNPFAVAGGTPGGSSTGRPFEETDPAGKTPHERIDAMVSGADVFLFMKGEPTFPQCGFSANTVAILDALGAEYRTFDVLADPDIRSGVKVYSDWPTFPQLYVKGELVGGNDIVTEMYRSGELQKMLGGAA